MATPQMLARVPRTGYYHIIRNRLPIAGAFGATFISFFFWPYFLIHSTKKMFGVPELNRNLFLDERPYGSLSYDVS